MRKPSRTAVALAGAAGAVALAAGVAQAVVPPADTPNMAAMTVQRADLGVGSATPTSGYVKPQNGFTAAYERSFRVANPPSGGAPFALVATLELAHNAKFAVTAVKAEKVLYSTKTGRTLLSSLIAASVPKKDRALLQSSLRFSEPVALSVGSDSFVESISVTAKGFTDVIRVATVAERRVVAALEFLGVGTIVPESAVSRLAGDVASHIRRVLATPSTGSTLPVGIIGPTGTTGASGSTGTTGTTGAT
jgi:hypothetical protein